jgi:hypothetical protein
MTREKVESRLISMRQDFHRLPPNTDYVELGGPVLCGDTEVIALDFEVGGPQTIDGDNTLVRVELRGLNWGACI